MKAFSVQTKKSKVKTIFLTIFLKFLSLHCFSSSEILTAGDDGTKLCFSRLGPKRYAFGIHRANTRFAISFAL